MEFSFNQPGEQSGQSSQQSIQSDRLRKAIERNRAKQAKRAGTSSKAAPVSEAKVVSDGWTLPGNPPAKKATRRSVAKVGEVEFTTPIRKSRKPSTAVSYGSSRSVTRSGLKTKARTKKAKAVERNDLIIKGVWVFCAFLMLRLVFSEGGVMDYYDRKSVMTNKVEQYKAIEKENQLLVKEIDQLRKNPRYQKKMVREHLGYIARDEYLILFAEDSSYQPI
ncbi:MAG: septum formation initiator family protein [Oligoflexia bacterium]|nr:septum formation initiator family protein [Oligoflexia bacterium]